MPYLELSLRSTEAEQPRYERALEDVGALAVTLLDADALLRGDTRPARVVDLTPVGEPQGEGVALFDDGRVVLTSEGGFEDNPASIAILRCPLE